MKKISEEQIKDIQDLINTHHTIKAKIILDKLEDFEPEKLNINLINFTIELKDLVNNLGRTNIITHRQLDELFVRYDINLKQLKDAKLNQEVKMEEDEQKTEDSESETSEKEEKEIDDSEKKESGEDESSEDSDKEE